tara:strand:+ start:614 stop:940 length:327 start_codon:yes stop_codon:yes gene_type:complete
MCSGAAVAYAVIARCYKPVEVWPPDIEHVLSFDGNAAKAIEQRISNGSRNAEQGADTMRGHPYGQRRANCIKIGDRDGGRHFWWHWPSAPRHYERQCSFGVTYRAHHL